jgi:hypothetical protein
VEGALHGLARPRREAADPHSRPVGLHQMQTFLGETGRPGTTLLSTRATSCPPEWPDGGSPELEQEEERLEGVPWGLQSEAARPELRVPSGKVARYLNPPSTEAGGYRLKPGTNS